MWHSEFGARYEVSTRPQVVLYQTFRARCRYLRWVMRTAAVWSQISGATKETQSPVCEDDAYEDRSAVQCAAGSICRSDEQRNIGNGCFEYESACHQLPMRAGTLYLSGTTSRILYAGVYRTVQYEVVLTMHLHALYEELGSCDLLVPMALR